MRSLYTIVQRYDVALRWKLNTALIWKRVDGLRYGIARDRYIYIYIYIYIYQKNRARCTIKLARSRSPIIYHGQCHTANRLRVSKLTQLTIFHRSSPRVYRHIHGSRRCTVATVQDEANPSSSQPAASCWVASESTQAHRDGWREYVLAEESVLPGNSRRKRGV